MKAAFLQNDMAAFVLHSGVFLHGGLLELTEVH
uniref:Uncharacterized protein n=1 Tax=Arundo donax TaxID=35708 RepID=A0A0A9IPK6_ARUDO